jgi:excinuclease ABC subunit A
MIEHDPTSILAADHVIDVGPGGGREGGEVICNASQSEFRRYTKSVTAKAICSYFNSLDNSLKTCSSKKELAYSNNKINSEKISSVTVTTNGVGNVKKGNLYFPLNAITVISGVSGAGKSTLLYRIIRDTLKNCEKIIEKNSSIFEWNYKGNNISSPQKIERVIEVDQKPIGKNARSTPISYLKLFDDFRKLFSSTLDARAKGFDASFFSYNSGKGRCADCHGLGVCRLEMSFLAEAKVICDTCDGTRYSEQARAIKFAGLSIADLLKLTFTEAKTLFANHRKIHQKLRLTCELGLGYLTLGQDSSTLSGGESQRLKLVAELSASQRGHTLYLLDEPTTGLHISDVQCLIKTLRQLVNMGNTVIVIEHEEQVITTADYIIELGPGAAMNGGKMIFSGSPKSLLGSKTPWGEVLRSRYKESIKVA